MRFAPLALGMVVLVTGCSEKARYTPEEGKAVAQACIDEVRAPGTYRIVPGQISTRPEYTVPRADAIEKFGATQAGEAAINACIQRRAFGQGQVT